jgi:hypothetical protein
MRIVNYISTKPFGSLQEAIDNIEQMRHKRAAGKPKRTLPLSKSDKEKLLALAPHSPIVSRRKICQIIGLSFESGASQRLVQRLVKVGALAISQTTGKNSTYSVVCVSI